MNFISFLELEKGKIFVSVFCSRLMLFFSVDFYLFHAILQSYRKLENDKKKTPFQLNSRKNSTIINCKNQNKNKNSYEEYKMQGKL